MKRFLFIVLLFFIFLLSALGMTGCESESYDILIPSDDPTLVYDHYEVTFKAGRDKRKIYGYAFIPKEYTGRLPTIIFSHGYNSTSRNMLANARHFASLGFACLAYDFCGGSEASKSDGKMSDMTLDSEKKDLLEIVRNVQRKKYVDKSKLFLFGESQGGLISTLFASEHSREIAGLVLLYPAFSAPNGAYQYYLTGKHPLNASEKYIKNAYTYYGKMDEIYDKCTMKTLIFHGDQDKLVPIAYSQQAVTRFPDAELVTMTGGEHGFSIRESVEMRTKMESYFSEVLAD